MTIQVISNDAPAKEVTEQKQESALEAKASEQNESTVSEAEETEAKDESEETEAEESEEEIEAKESEKDKPKKKGGFQRRIDKLNARYSAAQAEIDHWKEMALKGAGESKTEPVETQAATTEGKPNPDSFDTHAEYVESLTDWKIEQREKAAKAKEQNDKLQNERNEALKSHSERVKSFSKKTEDFSEVIESVEDVTVSAAVQEIIVSSENGPELMYELAKNREEFERINKLPPLAAARELGRIESKLSASEEKKSEPNKITKAPKPLDPVGSGKGSVTKDPNEMTQAEYEAYRRKQEARKQAS